MLAGVAGLEAGRPAPSTTANSAYRYIMIIDLNRCNGCQSCIIACKGRNRTSRGSFLTRVEVVETSQGPPIHFVPTLCNQCEEAPCAAACPEKATYKLDDSNIVFTDWKRCKGLGDCVQACPYGARHLDARFSNRSDKCDFCLDRIQRGQPPACVEHYPPRARIFGDRNQPNQPHLQSIPTAAAAQTIGAQGLRAFRAHRMGPAHPGGGRRRSSLRPPGR